MSYEIVVARYDENLDWLKKIDKSIKITIYNKGKDDIDFPYITLPNIGRESHTYLYHIINNYNNLADTTIFSQGDPIFHSPDFLKLLKLRKKFQPVQPLSAYYWPANVEPYGAVPPVELLELTKDNWIDNCRIHVQYLHNNFFTHYPRYDYEQHYDRFITTFKETYNIDNVLEFFVNRFNIDNVDLNELIPMCFSGLFSVQKHVILDKCVDYYRHILSFLIYDKRINNLDYGLLLEKAWLIIFNYKKYNKNYISLNIKDFILQDHILNIKNNSAKFKITTDFCRLKIDINFDNFEPNNLYYFSISSKECIVRHKVKKVLYKNKLSPILSKKIFKNNLLTFDIKLIDTYIIIFVNNIEVINYKINKKNIKKILVYDISKENKFKEIKI